MKFISARKVPQVAFPAEEVDAAAIKAFFLPPADFFFTLKSFLVWAQSIIKYKHLVYDEVDPGIKVDQDELEVLLELDNEDQASFLILHDTVTGASPTGVLENDTISGASSIGRGQGFANFEDSRTTFSLGYAPKLSRSIRLSGSFLHSDEKNYLSNGASLGATIELNKKNTTIAPFITHFSDVVRPRNGTPQKIKHVTDVSLNLSQVINKRNLITLGLSYGENRGYQTDPYKYIKWGLEIVPEARPDLRRKKAIIFNWRTMPFSHNALDLKLRYYQDDWDIKSFAYRVATLHEIGESWLLELFYRQYTQSAASFWHDQLPGGVLPRYRSADIRLSDFDTITAGFNGTLKMDDSLWLEGSLSRYSQFSKNCGIFGFSGEGGEESIYPSNNNPLGRPLFSANGDEGEEEGEGGQGGCSFWDGKGAFVTALVYSLGIQYRY